MKLLDCYRACRASKRPVAYCLRSCSSKPRLKPTSLKAVIYNATKCPPDHIYVRDAHLDTISVDDAKAFLAQDKTDLVKYIKEKHDCDDFANRLYCAAHAYFFERRINVAWINLWGRSIPSLNLQGEPILSSHAMNGFISRDMIHWIVEPQTDEIYTVAKYLRGAPRFELM